MDLINKIKELFTNEVPTENPVEVKLKDVKAQDGSVLRITEDLIVGAKVEVINEDGTLSVPTTPEITLEDGTVILIDENGIITEVKAVDAAPEAGNDKEAVPANKEAEDYSTRFETLEGQVSELFEAVSLLIDLAKSQNSNMDVVKAENTELKKQNQELSKKASAPAANFKKFEQTVEVKIETGKDQLLNRVIQIRESKNK